MKKFCDGTFVAKTLQQNLCCKKTLTRHVLQKNPQLDLCCKNFCNMTRAAEISCNTSCVAMIESDARSLNPPDSMVREPSDLLKRSTGRRLAVTKYNMGKYQLCYMYIMYACVYGFSFRSISIYFILIVQLGYA